MIQKLREVLLKEGNKENFFYIGAFLLLVPAFFFVFDLRRDKFAYAKIEDLNLDRRDLSIRFVDYVFFFKGLQGVFGDKGASQIRSYLIGNLSDEEYVVNNEIKNSTLLSVFKKSFGNEFLLNEIIIKKFSRAKEIEKEFGFFREIATEALSGNKDALSALQRQGVLIENLDNFIKKIYAEKFEKMALFLPFSVRNISYSNENKKIKKIKAKMYSFDIENYRKEIEKEGFSEDVLISFFEKNNFGGKYLSPFELYYDSISIDKENFKKEEVEEVFLAGLTREGEENPNKLNYAIEALNEKGFKNLKKDTQILKINSFSNEMVDSIGDLSLEIMKLNKNFDYSYICIEANGKFYFLILNKTDGGKPLDFNLVKEEVKEDFLKSESFVRLKNEIEENRALIESGEKIKKNGEILSFKLSENEDKDKKNKLKEALSRKNISKLRKNATFYLKNENGYELWEILEIEKEDSEKRFEIKEKDFLIDLDSVKENFKQKVIALSPEFEPLISNLKKSTSIDYGFGLSL